MNTQRRAQLCLVVLASFPALALAQAAVTVDATTVLRTVNSTHLGINTTLWDPQLATSGTVDKLTDAGIGMLRLPGGSLSDEYHWTSNTSRDNKWTWASGFDKSSWLLLNVPGVAGMVTVNYGSGTPEEAAAWVAYANFQTGTENAAGDVTLGVDSPTPGTGSVEPNRNSALTPMRCRRPSSGQRSSALVIVAIAVSSGCRGFSPRASIAGSSMHAA